ncbi:MFS transporter [Glaciibacter sp. 2TAF33]|uniref:MFS transporter n=1 Tax=Glaciibacter sp. 2TAF33 TaxID=3233015 RepID=UPI003F930259
MTHATSSTPKRGGPLGAFRHRGYSIFWVGALISSTGTWLGSLTVPYVLYQHTGSAIWVGLAAAAQFGPAFVLAPLGGFLADNHDRRLLLLWTQTGLGVIALWMWLQWASGWHDPLILIGAVTLFGVLNGINNPAWQSLVNDLVPREDLMSAVTFNSLQFNIARAVGPAIAGLLLASLGAEWAFFFNAVSFAVVVVALLFVRQYRPRAVGPSAGRFLGQWRDALRYMARSRAIMLAIGLCCLVGIFGNPIFTLTVVFAKDVFNTGPIGLGLLTAGLGAGAVLYAVAGTLFARRKQEFGRQVALVMVALGVALIVLSVMPTLALGIIAAVGVGAAFLAAFATLNTVIQLRAPDPLRGRVLAARHMVFSASIAFGVLLGGILTELCGVQLATILFGGALLVVAAAIRMLPGRGFPLLDSDDRPDLPPAESDSLN